MHTDPSWLQVIWFCLIGILWAGYFVLEGFDFGVGMLVKALAKDEVETRMTIHSIGPVWDGNEVWLLVAGGATFAAFPGWYATTFSGFYLALFLVLASLIVRGVSFEFWGKVNSRVWRSTWEWLLAISSGLAALLFGVAWANFVHGVPMGANHVVHASLLDLLHPYALLGGVTTLAFFYAHGARFLALRVTGDLQKRAFRMAELATPIAAVFALGFLIWTMGDHSWAIKIIIPGAITAALAVATILSGRRSQGVSFTTSALTIALLTATLACALYPNALPSTTNHAYDLSLVTASSSHYTLSVMSVVALVMVPVVLAYQSWTYWVFRHRLGRDDYEGALNPIAVMEDKFGGDSPTKGLF